MRLTKQKGMSSVLLIFLLATCGFLLTCFFKLGPAYLDNRFIVTGLKELAQNHPEDLDTVSKSQIKSELGKYYSINNVRGDVTNQLDVVRKKGQATISVTYDVRVPLIANIDALIKFDNVLDSRNPELCCKRVGEADK